MLHLIIAAAVSCLPAFVLTPAVRAWALRAGIVDAPDGFRKLHARHVPLTGGRVGMLACALSQGIIEPRSMDQRRILRIDSAKALPV